MEVKNLNDNMTLGDLEGADHSGWMVDLSGGPVRSCWCVLVDMLLCVFNDCEPSSKALKVIMLPGMEAKAIMYKTATYELQASDTVCNVSSGEHGVSAKTISGMLSFQILLSDPCSGAKHIFGVERQAEINRWLTLLKAAVNIDIFTDESSSSDLDVELPESAAKNHVQAGDSASRASSMGHGVQQGAPKKASMVTPNGNLLTSKINTVQKGRQSAVLDTNWKNSHSLDRHLCLRNIGCLKTNPKTPHTPQKSSYLPSHCSPTRISQQPVIEPDQRTMPELTRVSAESVRLFSKSLRFSSSSSALHEAGLCGSPKSVKDSLRPSPNINRTLPNVARHKLRASSSIDPDSEPAMVDCYQMSTAQRACGRHCSICSSGYAASGRNSAKSFSLTTSSGSMPSLKSRLMWKASNIRDKVFGTSTKMKDEVMLQMLTNIRISGYLMLKRILKWTQFWCVISNGSLYTFHTRSPSDTAEMILPLKGFDVHLLTQEKGKRHVLKMLHRNTRGMYFTSKDLDELLRWVFMIRLESARDCERQSCGSSDIAPAGESQRLLRGSQVSLDSSMSVVSHASMMSLGSLNSSNSQVSSLSSLSNHSSSSTGSASLSEAAIGFLGMNRRPLDSSSKMGCKNSPVSRKIEHRIKYNSNVKNLPSMQAVCPLHSPDASNVIHDNKTSTEALTVSSLCHPDQNSDSSGMSQLETYTDSSNIAANSMHAVSVDSSFPSSDIIINNKCHTFPVINSKRSLPAHQNDYASPSCGPYIGPAPYNDNDKNNLRLKSNMSAMCNQENSLTCQCSDVNSVSLISLSNATNDGKPTYNGIKHGVISSDIDSSQNDTAITGIAPDAVSSFPLWPIGESQVSNFHIPFWLIQVLSDL